MRERGERRAKMMRGEERGERKKRGGGRGGERKEISQTNNHRDNEIGT